MIRSRFLASDLYSHCNLPSCGPRADCALCATAVAALDALLAAVVAASFAFAADSPATFPAF